MPNITTNHTITYTNTTSKIILTFFLVVISKNYSQLFLFTYCRLRKMKSEFLNIPELAQCCSLADIVPPFQVCTRALFY